MAQALIRNVEKRFGSTQVIHGVNIAIDDGEFAVLVGPSGCGKTTRDVEALVAAGGELVVMPHADVAVVRAAKAANLMCIPGVATPTEAFAALAAGADALKVFPAEMLTPPVVKALRAVLPKTVRLLAVGGITPENIAAFAAAGADGFGLGSALYSAETPAAEVRQRAERFVDAWRSR
jgi:2-dehydro-3-deoxyphosphogalactonate aldolase